jgi:type II secretory ATPase GspE/PulE/Tfp pilus assembly ATPase PilB-like protein
MERPSAETVKSTENDEGVESADVAITDESPGQERQKALQEELRQLVDVVGPGPMVDLLLERAFQLNATDIHLDPTENGLRVRLRVDGMLHDVVELPGELTSPVISRMKLMADMDITERRMAQDGHISNAVLKQQRDVRVGGCPTIYGERLVLRLMPDETKFTRLDELGLDEAQTVQVHQLLQIPYGMILCAGPVGSGKSTTIYSSLEILNDPTKCLTTIEDPVERRIDGVNQVQVDPKIQFGFVQALRGVLRQDPDVMMIGEIRDPETAHIGVRAGLTGVTVLSTIHANDAAATIDVFREFEIPRTFMADSVRGVISQRLLRVTCPDCGRVCVPEASECEALGVPLEEMQSVQLRKGTGCDPCFRTGYLGRTGVFEIMMMRDAVRDAVLHSKSHRDLVKIAQANGMQTLEDSARKKVLSGATTVEEMHRVLLTSVLA